MEGPAQSGPCLGGKKAPTARRPPLAAEVFHNALESKWRDRLRPVLLRPPVTAEVFHNALESTWRDRLRPVLRRVALQLQARFFTTPWNQSGGTGSVRSLLRW